MLSKNARKVILNGLLVLAALLQGCSFGGGTIGTGLGFGVGNRPQHFIQFSVDGKLVGPTGAALSGVAVKGTTSSGEAITRTNSQGRFKLPVKMTSGESVKFEFTDKSGAVTCEAAVSPAGEDTLRMNFILKKGEVRCP